MKTSLTHDGLVLTTEEANTLELGFLRNTEESQQFTLETTCAMLVSLTYGMNISYIKGNTVAGFILDQNLMGQMAPSYKNQWVILKMYGSLDLTQHNV